MNKLQKKKNEMDEEIQDLVWAIQTKKTDIETLEKEIKESDELLNFLIKAKNMKEV